MLMRTQLRWAGHVSRMEDLCLPKIVLYGELATSYRKRGAPKKRYKDFLKQHLSLGHIDCHQCGAFCQTEIWMLHAKAGHFSPYVQDALSTDIFSKDKPVPVRPETDPPLEKAMHISNSGNTPGIMRFRSKTTVQLEMKRGVRTDERNNSAVTKATEENGEEVL
ncbi:hypothetical protein WISP_94159 [Willisornis vidua]|uniref:C2H2-type domain-containing protein n=1 Tax=Willisornis vidua TaxID=1566151 RepID=A0ABQ9D0N8_9PASS|nr:hypothetical protein WISP_94159 [Willisornis vidua]